MGGAETPPTGRFEIQVSDWFEAFEKQGLNRGFVGLLDFADGTFRIFKSIETIEAFEKSDQSNHSDQSKNRINQNIDK